MGLGNFQKKIPAQQKRLKRNRAREAMGEKIDQVLSFIQVLCLTLKKSFYRPFALQIDRTQPSGEKKFHATEN